MQYDIQWIIHYNVCITRTPTVHCMLCITLYGVHYIVRRTVHCTAYSTWYGVHCNVHCTVQCTAYIVRRTVYWIWRIIRILYVRMCLCVCARSPVCVCVFICMSVCVCVCVRVSSVCSRVYRQLDTVSWPALVRLIIQLHNKPRLIRNNNKLIIIVLF